MKKKVLIGIFVISMLAQSFAMPVQAATVTKEQTEVSTQIPEETSFKFSMESVEISEETPQATATEVPTEIPEKVTQETAKETPAEMPTKIPEETPQVTATEVPTEIPQETPQATAVSKEASSKASEEALAMISDAVAKKTVLSDASEEIALQLSEEYVFQEGAIQVAERERNTACDGIEITFQATVNWDVVYEYIYQQLKAKNTNISLADYNIPFSDSVGNLVYNVVNEHPDLYYVNVGKTLIWGDNVKATKIAAVYYDEYDVAAFETAVEDALSGISDTMSDMEKAIVLHDYLVLNCKYDTSSSLPRKTFTAYGALVDGKSVCQGYALAYKYLLSKVQIPCYMVTSESMNHAWNMVKLDGKYYHVDVTYDDPLADRVGYVRHRNMFLSDAQIVQSGHEDWVVTYRNETISCKATDTIYDSAFWMEVVSPLIIKGDYFYYIDNTERGIIKKNIQSEAAVILFQDFEKWSSISGSQIWNFVCSGLFSIGERLYFNSPDYIYSIDLNGENIRLETEKLSTAEGYVYGSAFFGGSIRYALHETYNFQGEETVLTTTLLNEEEVPVDNIILSQSEVTLQKGEVIALTAKLYPSYVIGKDVTWTSSDEGVATVKEGMVTAIGSGTCEITASAGGATASCQVTVAVPVYTVTFMDKGSSLPIKTEEVLEGESAVAPEIPTEKIPVGYTFAGWQGNYTNVQKDSIVYAVYQAIDYTITYELNGGENASENPKVYTIESAEITLQDPTKAEMKFVGWYTDASFSGNPVLTIGGGQTGNITLYAKWADVRGLWLRAEGTNEANVILNQQYSGKAIKPTVEVYYGDKLLKAGTDYTISYQNNIRANRLQSAAELKKKPTILIKGIGNYRGTLTKNFVIEPVDLEEAQIVNLAASYQDGKAVKPVPTVKWNGKKLTCNEDFVVTYPDSQTSANAYRQPGVYKVLVTAKAGSNYIGQKEITLTITKPKEEFLLSKAQIEQVPAQLYDGQRVELTKDMLKLTYGKRKLVMGTDYIVQYDDKDDYTHVGTHQVLLVGQGNYRGERRVSFQITGKSVKTMVIKMPVLVYDGNAKTPAANLDEAFAEGANTTDKLIITDKKGNKLTEGVDYTLKFTQNQNAGTAKMTLKGLGLYTGTLTKTFTIKAYSLSEGSRGITAEFADGSQVQAYQKDGARPKVIVRFYGKVLTQGVDYTLTYTNNTSVKGKVGKVPTVTINGKKNFTGSRKLKFTIAAQDISHVKISAADKEASSKVGAFYSTPVLTDVNGKKLKAGIDYKTAYVYEDVYGNRLGKKSKQTAGTLIRVTVTGKGNYKGTATTTYRIVKKGMMISDAKVTFNRKFYYTGEKIVLSKDDINVKVGKKTLQKDQYEIVSSSYKNNLNSGTAKVTIRGKEGYGGVKTISFQINKKTMNW